MMMPMPKDFHISSTLAFVLVNPIEKLPANFQPWQYCCDNIRALIEKHRLRSTIDNMAVLDANVLASSHRQQRLAHLQLTTLVSAYVWCNGEKEVPGSLPASLAVPYSLLSQMLGIKIGIAPHASVALANYRIKDKSKPMVAENLELIHFNFMEDYSNQWFFLSTIEIEIEFAKCIDPIFRTADAMTRKSEICMHDALEDFERGLNECCIKLDRLFLHLDSDIFFHKIRPYLSGTCGEPFRQYKGVIRFQGVPLEKSNLRLIGGSAAQSCIMQSVDAFLGIEHQPSVGAFLKTMSSLMLPSHRKFISWLRSLELRKCVEELRCACLVGAFNRCVQCAVNFRTKHVQLVRSYILQPQIRSETSTNKSLLGKTGTGGSSLEPFLNKIIESTRLAIITMPKQNDLI